MAQAATPDLFRRALRGAGRLGVWRLWAVAFALPLLGLFAAGWWSIVGVRAEFRADMLRTLLLLDGHTLHILQTQEVMLAAINSRVARLDWDEIERRPDIHAFVRALMDASGTVEALGLTSPNGHIAVAGETDKSPTWIDLSDRDFVAAWPAGTTRRHSFIAVPVFSRVDGRPQVHLSAPRIGPNGQPDGGAVVAGFAPALFERFFAAVAPSRHTGLTLVRDDGTALARYPEPISVEGQRRLPSGHPAVAKLAALERVPPDTPEMVDGGSLLAGPHMTAVVRIGDYPLLLVEEGDPQLLWARWARMMAFPAFGAAAAMALLAVLTVRVRYTAAIEQARLREAAAAAEAARASSAERAALEARLRQVEKTAALGQLAAGVAHDFNNLLQAVLSAAEALQRSTPTPQEVRSAATMIMKVVDRGGALTRRMLDYARRDDSAVVFPVAEALREVTELLARSLGTQHDLRLALPGGALPRICAVKAEFETVLINLVVNARDAMPDGGEIVLGATVAAESPPGFAAERQGAWLRVQVADTGRGMDAETLARAGEAFFTTKPRGQGTGLGLSMARGYAERSGGLLDLSSRPGRGTVVTLWLPVS